MKKKAIFLADNSHSMIRNVFLQHSVDDLAKLLNLEKNPVSKTELIQDKELCRNTQIIFSTWGMPIFSDAEIKNYFHNLEAVFYAAGSVQYFAKPFLDNNIRIFSSWGANAVPVAQFCVSLILLANKGFFQVDRIMRTSGYKDAGELANSFPGNYKTQVGIIGAGMIGEMIIKQLVSQGLTVKVSDPYLSLERAESLGVHPASLEELFSSCQTISNQMPDIPSTKGILSYPLFSKMSGNAVFINTGRGAQVIEGDLIRALEEKPGRTAILDVTCLEPPEKGNPFYTMENVILTPHIAGSKGKEVSRMGEYMVRECDRYLKNQVCNFEVKRDKLQSMA